MKKAASLSMRPFLADSFSSHTACLRRSLRNRSLVLSGGRCLCLPFLTPFDQTQSGKAGGEERQGPGQRNGRWNAGPLNPSFRPKGKQRTSHSICCRQTCDAKKECSCL